MRPHSRNKAARGELRRGLPVGFVWGVADGEVLLHPDEAVVTAIRTIFARFAETGSARREWLWFRDQRLQLPLQMSAHAEIRWVEASYHAIHQVLSNPVYAGAYVYGKTRTEMTLEPSGARRKRIKHLPRDQWQVLIKEHHRGYIDWQSYEANQLRIAKNTRPGPHKAGGAVREGSALLQGLASCGHCGRRLRTHYSGRNSTPGSHCSGEHLVEGRGIMRAASWSESIRDSEEVFLVDRVRQCDPRPLDDLVLQSRDRKRTLPAIWLGYVDPPARQCPIRSTLDPVVQVLEI